MGAGASQISTETMIVNLLRSVEGYDLSTFNVMCHQCGMPPVNTLTFESLSVNGLLNLDLLCANHSELNLELPGVIKALKTPRDLLCFTFYSSINVPVHHPFATIIRIINKISLSEGSFCALFRPVFDDFVRISTKSKDITTTTIAEVSNTELYSQLNSNYPQFIHIHSAKDPICFMECSLKRQSVMVNGVKLLELIERDIMSGFLFAFITLLQEWSRLLIPNMHNLAEHLISPTSCSLENGMLSPFDFESCKFNELANKVGYWFNEHLFNDYL